MSDVNEHHYAHDAFIPVPHHDRERLKTKENLAIQCLISSYLKIGYASKMYDGGLVGALLAKKTFAKKPPLC